MIITIDGAVATGKSTVAKKLAKSLGFIYFDTGAMYRAVTLALLQENISLDNHAEILNFLHKIDFDIKIKLGEKHYYINGKNVTQDIRTQEVSDKVSEVAAIPEIRQKLVAIQREQAQNVNSVFEGRDMGTVVFPNADLKIFLTGDPKVRAERRFKEMLEKFPEKKDQITLDKILEHINERDHKDSTRETSPLKQAESAFLIDTTDLDADEVVYKILEYKDSKKTRH